jgi:hypothetical protein
MVNKKERHNPNWYKPAGGYIGGIFFHSTGTIYTSKAEAKAEAEKWRKMGHRARVIPRKSMFGGKQEYHVVRDKY